jgi:hypothetical protein
MASTISALDSHLSFQAVRQLHSRRVTRVLLVIVFAFKADEDERSVGCETAPCSRGRIINPDATITAVATATSPPGTNRNSPRSRGGWVTAVTRRATWGRDRHQETTLKGSHKL